MQNLAAVDGVEGVEETGPGPTGTNPWPAIDPPLNCTQPVLPPKGNPRETQGPFNSVGVSSAPIGNAIIKIKSIT